MLRYAYCFRQEKVPFSLYEFFRMDRFKKLVGNLRIFGRFSKFLGEQEAFVRRTRSWLGKGPRTRNVATLRYRFMK